MGTREAIIRRAQKSLAKARSGKRLTISEQKSILKAEELYNVPLVAEARELGAIKKGLALSKQNTIGQPVYYDPVANKYYGMRPNVEVVEPVHVPPAEPVFGATGWVNEAGQPVSVDTKKFQKSFAPTLGGRKLTYILDTPQRWQSALREKVARTTPSMLGRSWMAPRVMERSVAPVMSTEQKTMMRQRDFGSPFTPGVGVRAAEPLGMVSRAKLSVKESLGYVPGGKAGFVLDIEEAGGQNFPVLYPAVKGYALGALGGAAFGAVGSGIAAKGAAYSGRVGKALWGFLGRYGGYGFGAAAGFGTAQQLETDYSRLRGLGFSKPRAVAGSVFVSGAELGGFVSGAKLYDNWKARSRIGDQDVTYDFRITQGLRSETPAAGQPLPEGWSSVMREDVAGLVTGRGKEFNVYGRYRFVSELRKGANVGKVRASQTSALYDVLGQVRDLSLVWVSKVQTVRWSGEMQVLSRSGGSRLSGDAFVTVQDVGRIRMVRRGQMESFLHGMVARPARGESFRIQDFGEAFQHGDYRMKGFDVFVADTRSLAFSRGKAGAARGSLVSFEKETGFFENVEGSDLTAFVGGARERVRSVRRLPESLEFGGMQEFKLRAGKPGASGGGAGVPESWLPKRREDFGFGSTGFGDELTQFQKAMFSLTKKATMSGRFTPRYERKQLGYDVFAEAEAQSLGAGSRQRGTALVYAELAKLTVRPITRTGFRVGLVSALGLGQRSVLGEASGVQERQVSRVRQVSLSRLVHVQAQSVSFRELSSTLQRETLIQRNKLGLKSVQGVVTIPQMGGYVPRPKQKVPIIPDPVLFPSRLFVPGLGRSAGYGVVRSRGRTRYTPSIRAVVFDVRAIKNQLRLASTGIVTRGVMRG